MSAPENRAMALQVVKKAREGGKKRSNFWSLRVKSRHLKNNDPLLDVAVSYSDHP